MTTTHRVNKKLATEEANATHDFDGLRQKADVEDGFREIDVTKVARTLGHVAGAGLAARTSVDHPLARVHQPAELRTPSLHRLRVADATLGDGHTPLQSEQWTISCQSSRSV